jgi:hypothetical protein
LTLSSSRVVKGPRALGFTGTGLSPIGWAKSKEVHPKLVERMLEAEGTAQPRPVPQQATIAPYLHTPRRTPTVTSAQGPSHPNSDKYLLMRRYHKFIIKKSNDKSCICCFATGKGDRDYYLRLCNFIEGDEDLGKRINDSK